MSAPEAPREDSDQLMREAAAWFARMRGPEAEASREAFEAWLRRGALHRGAYNRAAEIFAMGKEFASAADPGSGTSTSTSTSTKVRRSVITGVGGALLALSGAAVLLFTLAPATQPPPAGSRNPLSAEVLTTTRHETRSIRLADGSTVVLGPDAALDVWLGSSQRRLVLRRGAARFDVFHERRPFIVYAGGGRVVALGTVFDVGFPGGRTVTVRLISGVVEVDLPPSSRGAGPPAERARRLRPGQSISFASGERGDNAASTPGRENGHSPAPAADARDYRQVRVADLIAEANRRSTRPIRIAEPSIGGLRVSGRFRIDDTALLAARVALLFGLEVEEEAGEIVLGLQ